MNNELAETKSIERNPAQKDIQKQQKLGAISLSAYSKKAEKPKLEESFLVFPVNDADSLATKKLLEEYDIDFATVHLPWGSSWSDATDDFKSQLSNVPEKKKIVAFGLKGSLENENVTYLEEKEQDGRKQSNLEMVASMLGVELNTEQRFVVANNEGYIPAMTELGEKLGLSQEETAQYIKKVNQMEEEGQGISEQDKLIAKQALENAYIYDERLMWVELPKFSAMREVTNDLYALGKYKDLAYNTVAIESPETEARLVVFSNKNILDGVEQMSKELGVDITWKHEKDGHGYWGVQVNNDEAKRQEVTEKVRDFLEDQILGYHRFIEQKDIISSKTYDKGVQIHHVNNGGAFRKAIEAAHDKSDYGAYLCMDYFPEDYKSMDMIIVNAGAAGIAVKENGDIVSVFKNPDIAKKDNVEKINRALVLEALKAGGKKLDCFDGRDSFLPKLYARAGMVPICKLKFNDKFAPKDWNYGRDGRPDIIFMAHCGDSMEDVVRKYDNKEYPNPVEAIKDIPYVEGYKEADVLVEQYLKDIEARSAKSEKKKNVEEARKKYVFLLGGHDLEMNHIRQILEKNGVDYVDENLSWGAKAEDYFEKYSDCLYRPNIVAGYKMFEHRRKYPENSNFEYVAVELDNVARLSTSENIVDINHHGSRAGEKASILQVLDLLGIEPTREDLLIAANDSGFIPAMEKMGATQEEIAEIRRRDRASQGVTEEEEKISEEAVNNCEIDGRLTTVKIPFTHSSPVSDRLYGKSDQLLIVEETNKGLALDFSGTTESVAIVAEADSAKKVRMLIGDSRVMVA